jgi:hypothetical protein
MNKKNQDHPNADLQAPCRSPQFCYPSGGSQKVPQMRRETTLHAYPPRFICHCASWKNHPEPNINRIRTNAHNPPNLRRLDKQTHLRWSIHQLAILGFRTGSTGLNGFWCIARDSPGGGERVTLEREPNGRGPAWSGTGGESGVGGKTTNKVIGRGITSRRWIGCRVRRKDSQLF